MAIRKGSFVLCLVAFMLIFNLGANAALFNDDGIPAPPGHGDNPAPAGHGDNPNPPGPGDRPSIPDLSDIPNPPGHGDYPDAPGHDDNPNPPGPGDLPNIPDLGDILSTPDLGDIPDPPGHGDYPDPVGHGDNPNPPGPGDHPEDQLIGLENALEHVGEDSPAYDVLSYISGLEDFPPDYPPGQGEESPVSSDIYLSGFESQPMGASSVGYSAIPEPASLGLLIIGGLALLRRRR